MQLDFAFAQGFKTVNIAVFLMARSLKGGKFGRAFALLPLLGKMSVSQVIRSIGRLGNYILSGKASKKEIALLLGAILYLIWPMDVLPDFLPFAGVLDDVAIATIVFGYLHRRAAEAELGGKSVNA